MSKKSKTRRTGMYFCPLTYVFTYLRRYSRNNVPLGKLPTTAKATRGRGDVWVAKGGDIGDVGPVPARSLSLDLAFKQQGLSFRGQNGGPRPTRAASGASSSRTAHGLPTQWPCCDAEALAIQPGFPGRSM